MYRSLYRLGPFGSNAQFFIDVNLESPEMFKPGAIPDNESFEAFIEYASSRLAGNFQHNFENASVEAIARNFYHWLKTTTNWLLKSVVVTDYSSGMFCETRGEFFQ